MPDADLCRVIFYFVMEVLKSLLDHWMLLQLLVLVFSEFGRLLLLVNEIHKSNSRLYILKEYKSGHKKTEDWA